MENLQRCPSNSTQQIANQILSLSREPIDRMTMMENQLFHISNQLNILTQFVQTNISKKSDENNLKLKKSIIKKKGTRYVNHSKDEDSEDISKNKVLIDKILEFLKNNQKNDGWSKKELISKFSEYFESIECSSTIWYHLQKSKKIKYVKMPSRGNPIHYNYGVNNLGKIESTHINDITIGSKVIVEFSDINSRNTNYCGIVKDINRVSNEILVKFCDRDILWVNCDTISSHISNKDKFSTLTCMNCKN